MRPRAYPSIILLWLYYYYYCGNNYRFTGICPQFKGHLVYYNNAMQSKINVANYMYTFIYLVLWLHSRLHSCRWGWPGWAAADSLQKGCCTWSRRRLQYYPRHWLASVPSSWSWRWWIGAAGIDCASHHDRTRGMECSPSLWCPDLYKHHWYKLKSR